MACSRKAFPYARCELHRAEERVRNRKPGVKRRAHRKNDKRTNPHIGKMVLSDRVTEALKRFEALGDGVHADPASNYVIYKGKTRGQKGDQVPRAAKRDE